MEPRKFIAPNMSSAMKLVKNAFAKMLLAVSEGEATNVCQTQL